MLLEVAKEVEEGMREQEAAVMKRLVRVATNTLQDLKRVEDDTGAGTIDASFCKWVPTCDANPLYLCVAVCPLSCVADPSFLFVAQGGRWSQIQA